MDLDETSNTGSVQEICKDIDNVLDPTPMNEDTGKSGELGV